jgi:predicted nuclease of predicted toxin-antitoxin system
VKFLIDAQLPLRLSNHLAGTGHDSIHTSALPEGNRTNDRQLATIADSGNRVLVTKDRDFRDSHLLLNVPRRLSSSQLAISPTTIWLPCSRSTWR